MATRKPTQKKTVDLIAQWTAIVAAVEKGYRFGLYDYRNDLDVRSLIEEAGAADQVAALDKRFQAALTGKKVRVWESDTAGAFWCYGYPKKTNAEFKQDLKAEGLI
jgi:hypothetical protein